MSAFLLALVLMTSIYVKKFDSDFKEEDKQKVGLFIAAVCIIAVVLIFVRG